MNSRDGTPLVILIPLLVYILLNFLSSVNWKKALEKFKEKIIRK